MDGISDRIGAMIAAFISLAVIAIVVSNAANTTNVLTSFFSGIANLIGVAISPVTGQSVGGLNASGVSASGLTGGGWANGSGGFALTTTSSGGGGVLGGVLGGVTTGASNALANTIGGNISNALGNLFSGGGGSNDGGSWDSAPTAVITPGAGDFIDSGSF